MPLTLTVHRRFSFAAIFAAVTTVITFGCHRASYPDLVDKLGTAIDDPEQSFPGDPLKTVPIIVVASVVENRIVEKHVRAACCEGFYLDLHRVRGKLENALKGNLEGTELTFFYFGGTGYPETTPTRYPPANNRLKRSFRADPGSQYLFFLMRDKGTLRSIGDVGDYSIPVLTGVRPERSMESEDLGRRVSRILLSPGDGADLNGLAKSLLTYSNIADTWGSRPFSVQLLRELIPLGEPVRSQACGVLVEHYEGQYDCLEAIAKDSNETLENRQEALRELQEKAVRRRILLDELKDPAQLGASDSLRKMREEYETLLFSSDPVIHDRTCTALRRYFPRDAEPKCSQAK
jgi:hypothetical protein